MLYVHMFHKCMLCESLVPHQSVTIDLSYSSVVLCCRTSKWKKRGLAIVPTMYGVAFGQTFLNQGSALVHVYTDGSVLLTHGGMEMGQV